MTGNPHSPFSLGPETPPPAYSPHDDGGGIDRPPAPSSAGSVPGQNMETDNNTTLSEAVPYQVFNTALIFFISKLYSID